MYTTAFFQADKARYKDVWIAVDRKGNKFSVPDWNNESPTHIFVYGKGTIKLTKSFKLELIRKPQEIKNYADVNDLVIKYGHEAAGKLLGFEPTSYGDVRPFRELRYFESLGAKYLSWLNSLALVDSQMLEFFLNRGLVVKNNNYDMWIIGQDICSFRKNPFLGWNIETAILGFPFEIPSLDVIRIHDVLYPILEKLGVKNVVDMSLVDMFKCMGIEINSSIVGLDK
jgi:hypothetical protein